MIYIPFRCAGRVTIARHWSADSKGITIAGAGDEINQAALFRAQRRF
jgi:hypothetical protein